jgi:hypothetical protein
MPVPDEKVLQVTEGKQLHGKEMTLNEAYSVSEPGGGALGMGPSALRK